MKTIWTTLFVLSLVSVGFPPEKPIATYVVSKIVPVQATKKRVESLPCYCRVDNVRVHDADTLRGDVVMPFYGIVLVDQSIRAADFDAWEVSYVRQKVVKDITPAEIKKGETAKRELEDLLKGSTLYVSPFYGKTIDPYKRIDAKWTIQRPDGEEIKVAEWAKSHGWLRPDSKKKKEKENPQ